MTPLERFQGGRQLMIGSAVVGALGLVAVAIGGAAQPRQALFSYLVALAFWLGIALGALILLSIFHASNAKWPVVVRRMLEKMASSSIVFLPLFLPVALGMTYLFVWVSKPAELGARALELIEHKRLYLNVPFFLVRAGIYFLLWIVVSYLLSSWSTRQDTSPDLRLTLKQRRLGAGSLPFLALSITFAAFDWLMSLDPTWYSTIFGVYFFAGSFVAAIALLTLITVLARGANLFGSLVSPDHYHNLGNFLLAFTVFWAYIGFSQFMLIWIANLPEEVSWYLVRAGGRWRSVGIGLAIAHFLVPFFALLSSEIKRNPRTLAVISAWILLWHYLDVYWVVMPALHPEAPAPHWIDLAALAGVGGIAVAYTLWTLRGGYTIPVGDPYLQASLQFRRP